MPRFVKYLRGNPYYDPERVTSSVARPDKQAFLQSTKEKNVEGLSPVVKTSAANPDLKYVNVDQISRHKARALLAAFEERHFADPKMRDAYRDLRAIEMGRPKARQALIPVESPDSSKKKAREGQENVKPSGANKKYYDPTGKGYAVTTSGTIARARAAGWMKHHMIPGYHLASKVVPCIQMATRREVMFAKKKAGKGYKVRHRFNPLRIPC